MKEKIIKCIEHALDLEQDEVIADFAADGVSSEEIWDQSWKIAAEQINDRGFAEFNDNYDICGLDSIEEYTLAEKIFVEEIKKHL